MSAATPDEKPEEVSAAPVPQNAVPEKPEAEKAGALRRWLRPETRSRRLLIGAAIYVTCLLVFAVLAGDRLLTHTPQNHYALLADAWLHGRQDLPTGAPSYSGNNDFGVFEGKTYITFPPFPAVLMLPLVAIAGSPENFRDGQFIVWLAAIGPAILFLILEKIRRTARSKRTEEENVALSLLFAFGTVYFYSSVQGTVWFAAHVVGVGLSALFVLCALDAERPWFAGGLLGCMFMTRPTSLLIGVFFVFEAIRVCCKENATASEGTSFVRWLHEAVARVDERAFARRVTAFALPLAVGLAFASYLNWQRFHDPRPWAFGHEHLAVRWQARMQRWGLFSTHYLSRNLAVLFAAVPWRPSPGEGAGAISGPLGALFKTAPFVMSMQGVALWFTTPLYLWLRRAPEKGRELWWATVAAAAGPFVMNLLYQNSGWRQFGYRFSNDYALLLFVMLALSVRRFGRLFWACAIWAVVWNLFGAMTFDRQGSFYIEDPRVFFPAD